jgi:RNA polymerase-binding transcription factor DksA
MGQTIEYSVTSLPLGGEIWASLRTEREKTCAAILKSPHIISQLWQRREEIDRGSIGTAGEDGQEARESLYARLSRIDDALDRLMSGTYGCCRVCGQRIEPQLLATDPAASHCLACQPAKATEQSIPVPAGNSPNKYHPFERRNPECPI